MAVNSDSPAIPAAYLRLAVERLAPGRIVLGPAADGGYYAVGIDRRTWASHEAAAAAPARSWRRWARRRCCPGRWPRPAGPAFEAVQLPLWLDIDEAADLPVLERLASDGDLRGAASVALGLREVYLHLTNRCGSACRHCYNRANPWEPDELSTAEWRRAIDDCVALGASSFVFLGGDPLLRDDLCELLEHVTGRHGLKARLFFNSPDHARAGRRAGRPPAMAVCGRWSASTAPRRSTTSCARRATTPPCWPRSPTCWRSDSSRWPTPCCCAPTLPGLPALARELARAGVTRLHLILPHQRGALPDNPELVPTGAEMLAGLRELRRRRRRTRPGGRQSGGLAPPAGAAPGLLHGRLPGPGDRPLRRGPRLHDHDRRSGLRGRRPAARVAGRHLAIVAGAASAARRAGPGSGRVRRLPGRRRLRRRVLDAGPLRGSRAPAGRPARARRFRTATWCDPLFAELLDETGHGAWRRRGPPGAVASGRAAGSGQAAAGAADYALFDCI